jgi:hypothetical protein
MCTPDSGRPRTATIATVGRRWPSSIAPKHEAFARVSARRRRASSIAAGGAASTGERGLFAVDEPRTHAEGASMNVSGRCRARVDPSPCSFAGQPRWKLR